MLNVSVPASGFVTVTLRAPRAAPLETEMTTVSCEALFRVTDTTVIPEPESDTVAPATNPLPVKITVRFD